jgi:hypothetical protein
MSMARLALLAAIALLVAASPGAESPPSIPAGEDFGAGLTLGRTTPLAEVVRDPERFQKQRILLHGRVSDVCQRKGCWTILQDGNARLRVRFQDYGFFLPKDASGAEAFAEGFVSVETLSEEEARHYESESRGGDPGSVVGPRREIGFTASGVRLVRSR